MRKHGPEELADLLEQPLVAVLATYRRDGGVLLSPVWHRWRHGGFDVVVYENDIKLKHLRRDPRASIVVYEHEPPYRGLEARGEARLLQDGVAEAARSMAVRYLGAENGRAYAAAISPADSVLVRLEPTDVRGWDFADDMAAFAGG
ncbi:MAG TPA: TIGR03618 family F420-dependent PPOX class oxidoreductase [Gaiellaceae bacterium]|nr:TIGR03618 family F420-dependent PPOX class oxidoreductase [Gaiellaceae bacterium]